MPTPFGHVLAGVAAGRILRLREPGELAAFAGLATLPDIDLAISLVLRGDPMVLHRHIGTHRPLAPIVAGAGGWLLARDGRRARTAAIVAGAVALHLLADGTPLPYPQSDGTRAVGWFRFIRNVVIATAMDLAVFGPLAALTLALTREPATSDA